MRNWFENLTGFIESDYNNTQAKLFVDGDRLCSSVNGLSWAIGRLEIPSLGELRAHVGRLPPFLSAHGATSNALRVSNQVLDAHTLHALPEATGALIQVASQFNLLEMVDPSVTPEDGVTRYHDDFTQGPACAMAAGPATLYRNYFVPMAGGVGQNAQRQINTLSDLLQALPVAAGASGVRMRNGYALTDVATLKSIHLALSQASSAQLDAWRCLLRIGVHWNVEVTAEGPACGQRLSQAFCSALPVSYSAHREPNLWAPFARLVLEAAYEATLLSALVNAAQGGSRRVYLTLLGGGAFGNERAWILDAMRRALIIAKPYPLEVVIVNFNGIQEDLVELVESLVADR